MSVMSQLSVWQMRARTSVVMLPSLPSLAMVAGDRPVAWRRSSRVMSRSMRSFHSGLKVMVTAGCLPLRAGRFRGSR